MKTTLPIGLPYQKLAITLTTSLLLSLTAISQDGKGKDGAASYFLPGSYILNRYSSLASSAPAGSLSVTVSNIAELSGSYSFIGSTNPYATNALSKGDLIMIIQVQGADITTTDDAAYGAITDYHSTGDYELRTVFNVSGNTISLCQNLSRTYTQSGRSRAQVVRIPRLTSLNISSGATVSGMAWNGASGGIVALESTLDMTIIGAISGNSIGFRGGVDDKANSVTSGSVPLTLYRTTVTTTTAGKGESIAGNTADYNTYLNGSNGRGAPANGGGGGNGHNSGGGGGSNAGTNGALSPWNGTGIKNTSNATWTAAWNLESAGFATNVSVGAGRGGYSYSNSNQDALILAPGNASWGGDKRNIVGGFGGRPLNYVNNTRAFMGGGGGAGDGNNSSSGNGGNGGGIVYLLCRGNITGSGSITANGQDGYNTILTNIDAAGGAGGGGSVLAMASGTITGISITANGGNGGNQLFLLAEAEGPGGGGGGGYIGTTSTSVTRTVAGGDNGTSASAMVTEFLPNGATQGAAGTIASVVSPVFFYCDATGVILSIKMVSFQAIAKDAKVAVSWTADQDNADGGFEVERSYDGQHFTKIASVSGKGPGHSSYSLQDKDASLHQGQIYYRLRIISGNDITYSEIRIVRFERDSNDLTIVAYPNPVSSNLRITLPSSWNGKLLQVGIYDISGKLLKSRVENNATATFSMNLQELGSGMYMVRVRSGEFTLQQLVVKK